MSSSDTITTISPNTNQPILTRQTPSSTALAAIPRDSATAFRSFAAGHPLEKRQSIVEKALRLVLAKKDVLARELTEQMGRPIKYAHIEIETAVKRAEYLLKISGECLADTEGDAETGFKRWIRKCPRGCVLVLFAWNVSDIYWLFNGDILSRKQTKLCAT